MQGFFFAQELWCILLCNHFIERKEDCKLSGERYQANARVNMLLINTSGMCFSHVMHNVKFV
jgi:hypothetical protein